MSARAANLFSLRGAAPPVASHALHTRERAWAETNCYVDLWVEVLHALGCDPSGMLAFTVAADFEGDQWTFFKPPLADLHALYGVDVQELCVYRDFLEQTLEQLSRGKLVVSEADAFFLPDTAGTDYRTAHSKTTIGIAEIDLDKHTLGYFHNTGYHALASEDFAGFFGSPGALPLYVEFARLERLKKLAPAELVARSKERLRFHLSERPKENPLLGFAARFTADLPALAGGTLVDWHKYAFVSLRQIGACMELAQFYVEWLAKHDDGPLNAAEDFSLISQTAKMLILKGARMVASKRVPEVSAPLQIMADAWARAMDTLSVHA